MRHERLFKPCRANLFKHRQPQRSRLDVFAPNLSGINQQDAIRAKAFPRCVKLIDVCGKTPASERTPAAFDCTKSVGNRTTRT
jgi:hypothetical protein